jgi:2-octaprenyl-6-methoxyphenol hydroxylase
VRLVDDTGRLIGRQRSVRLREIGLDVFGYNIENRALIEALEQRAAGLSGLTRFDDEAATISPDDAEVVIHTRAGESLAARLVVGADGRQSLCRQAAGIEVSRRSLNQAALTFNISHSRPHRDISTEFHTPHGPCVFVPLPGDRSSVVWVAAPKEAERLIALSDDELSEAAERQSHSILGRVSAEAGRHLFPLGIEQPRQFAKARIVLVGEAAHVLPPIGAQGLNMGLRDAADIADIVRDAMLAGEDPGAPQVIKRYDSARRSDVASRTFAIDMANRSLLSDFLPVQSLRAGGHASDRFGRRDPPSGHARGPGAVVAAVARSREYQPAALNEPHHAGQRDDGGECSNQDGDRRGLDPGVVLPGDHEHAERRRQCGHQHRGRRPGLRERPEPAASIRTRSRMDHEA